MTVKNYLRSDIKLQFFKALYGDKVFTGRLIRKTGWFFSSYENLLSVTEDIPSFRNNTLRIALILHQKQNIWPAIRLLERDNCVDMLSLDIEPLGNPDPDSQQFDLSALATSFPSLKTLFLSGLDGHEGSFDSIDLERMYIRFSRMNRNRLNSTLVHLQSPQTLTTLHIVNGYDIIFNDDQPLDSFNNLKDFEVVPLSDEICRVLTTTENIKLLRFGASLFSDDPPIKAVSAMFSALCFKEIHILKIQYVMSKTVSLDEYFECSEIIINCITRKLGSIHTLTLDMGMDILWCPSFSHLEKLKYLCWDIKRNKRDEVLLRNVEGCNQWEKSKVRVIGEFQKVFAYSEGKQLPLIEIF